MGPFVHEIGGEKQVESQYVNYSEFFRNPLTFAALEKIVLPGLLRTARNSGRRELRIWSAGCAAGQEPYSVAILLEEIMEKSGRTFDYRIFATDGLGAHISLARAGVFTDGALGNMSMKRLNRWFLRQADAWAVSPELAGHIDFSVFNLLNAALSCPAESIFGNFDLVLCCNLLFYYNTGPRKSILDKLTKCLGDKAYLVTGETERGFIMENGFRELFAESAVFSKILET
jgi:chemotaxis protein methyltransferase CheR